MIPSPIRKALSTIQKHRVAHLLMGGQACVLYGAAEFSHDLGAQKWMCLARWQPSVAASWIVGKPREEKSHRHIGSCFLSGYRRRLP